MNFKSKAPNQKVYFVLVITVFIVVFSISYSSYKKNNPESSLGLARGNNTFVAVRNEIKNDYLNIEKDGVMSWQQVLDDLKTEDGIPENYNFGVDPDLDSVTAEVGIDAIMGIMQSMTSPNSKFNPEDVLNMVTEKTSEHLDHRKKYSPELMFSVKTSDEAVRNYFNQLLQITNDGLVEALETPSLNDERFVLAMAKMYSKLSIKLSSVQIPDVLVNVHTEYINTLDSISFYTEIMMGEFNDPIMAYSAIPKFNDGVAQLERLYTQIISYPKNNGIIFEEDDYAYELLNEI